MVQDVQGKKEPSAIPKHAPASGIDQFMGKKTVTDLEKERRVIKKHKKKHRF
jgi:hypothetical protein